MGSEEQGVPDHSGRGLNGPFGLKGPLELQPRYVIAAQKGFAGIVAGVVQIVAEARPVRRAGLRQALGKGEIGSAGHHQSGAGALQESPSCHRTASLGLTH